MTNIQIERTKQAIKETQLLLNKELSYLPHNQKQDMIAFYKNHLVKLNGMLN